MKHALAGPLSLGGALALALVLAGSVAYADALADGKSAYKYKKYTECVEKLFAVLNPVLVGDADAVDAREHLAACYFHLWKSGGFVEATLRGKAEDEITFLLLRDKTYTHKLRATLDDDFRRYFDEFAKKFREAKRVIEAAEAKAKAEEADALRRKIRDEMEILYASKEPVVFKIVKARGEPEVAHFIPLYGQIYNRDFAAAAIFGLTDMALVATSLFTYVELKRMGNPAPNFELARAYKLVNALSTTGAILSIAGGIVQALLRRRELPESLREMTTAEKIRYGIWKPRGDFAPDTPGTAGDAPPRDDSESKSEPGATAPKPKLYLLPLDAPADAGASLGLSLELRF